MRAIDATSCMSNIASSHRRFPYYLSVVVTLALYRFLIAGSIGPNWSIACACTAGLFAVAVLVRQQMEAYIESGPIVARQKKHVLAEISIYCVVSAVILLVDMLWLDQTILTVLRYAALTLLFGYLVGIDCTLARIPSWFDTGDHPFRGKYRMLPTVWRLAVVPSSILVGFTAIVSLALYAFNDGVGSSDISSLESPFRNFAFDVAFSLLLVTVLGALIINSYAANLKAVMDRQVKVLTDIQTGDLSGEVPIISHDAFGLLASQINRVSEYLRERERIYDVLKRIVSPSIMEKLVNTDQATLRQGKECDLAILFCDIRGFTAASESSSASEMILFLNSYFADMSELVTAHNGIINKFLGDGILAVFGVDDQSQPAAEAFDTALDIAAHSEGFTLPDGSTPEMGFGIHHGSVIAGTVGSADRFEYTFLGDPVNTASRLEGLSKRLAYKIIVSADAYLLLGEEHRAKLDGLGAHRLRGKVEPVMVFGALNIIQLP